MTTNHYDRLDPALIRPGRVDYQQFIGLCSQNQIVRMFNRFYPNHPDLVQSFVKQLEGKSVSPAQLQGHFILHKDDPMKAIQNAFSLFLSPNNKEAQLNLHKSELT